MDGARWLNGASRRSSALVFVMAATVYLATAHYLTHQVNDTQAVIWPAWEFVHHATFMLDHASGLPHNDWIYRIHGHLVSARVMGAVLAGVPVCAALWWTGLSPTECNAVNAALIAAATITVLYALLRRLAPQRLALAATAVVACGTPMWTVAAAETWPQTVDTLFLALMLLALTRQRLWWAGLALAPALLARPDLAVVAFVMGLGLGARGKSLRPLLAFGLPALASGGLLAIWNHWMYGRWTVLGNYQVAITTLSHGWSFSDYLMNAAGAAFTPTQGLFVFTPVAALAVWWMVRRRRHAPPWAVLALASGLGYEAIQLRIDDYSGGGGFFGSRLTIELIMLATPMAVVCYQPWSANHPARRAATTVLAALGIATFAVGALLSFYLVKASFGQSMSDYWRTYYPLRLIRTAGLTGLLVAVVVLGCVGIVGIVVIDRYRQLRTSRPPAPGSGAVVPPREPAEGEVAAASRPGPAGTT